MEKKEENILPEVEPDPLLLLCSEIKDIYLNHLTEPVSSEEEMRILRRLFQFVPELDFVPKSLHDRTIQLFSFLKLKRGQKLVRRTSVNVPAFILLSGELTIRFKSAGSDTLSVLPGQTCGNYQQINDKKFRACNIISLSDDSSVLQFSPESLSKLISQENSNSQFKDLVGFLCKAIPGFSYLSRNAQQRIGRFFKERVYLPNQVMIREGDLMLTCLLVREGECIASSKQSPLKEVISLESAPLIFPYRYRPNPRTVGYSKMPGFISRSTNSYQYRLIYSMEWVGEEYIINSELIEEPIEYSVTARTTVTALEISRDSIHKFPSSILDSIALNSKKKVVAHAQRKCDLQESISKIYSMNPQPILEKRRTHSIAKINNLHSGLSPLKYQYNKSQNYVKPKLLSSSINCEASSSQTGYRSRQITPIKHRVIQNTSSILHKYQFAALMHKSNDYSDNTWEEQEYLRSLIKPKKIALMSASTLKLDPRKRLVPSFQHKISVDLKYSQSL